VTFVDSAKTVVRQELTRDTTEIVEAAENMFIEGGATAVLDAVRLSLEHLSANGKNEPGRTRALLLITDGDDRGSQAKLETVIAVAKDAKIRIVVVGMTDDKLNTKLLDRLAKETGGAAFYPRTPKDMIQAIDSISLAIRRN
jgi:Mg-chelatase subunit ChlD